MDLHPDCEALGFLLGTWAGAGVGDYPTIERFEYLEEVTIGHVGKPFLTYTQRTRDRHTNAPLHAETGYFRAVGDRGVELVVVQPSGILEIHRGHVEGTALDFELVSVMGTPTAKEVTDVRRSLRVDTPGHGGGTGSESTAPVLSYDLWMAAVGEPLTHHLRAELHRRDP